MTIGSSLARTLTICTRCSVPGATCCWIRDQRSYCVLPIGHGGQHKACSADQCGVHSWTSHIWCHDPDCKLSLDDDDGHPEPSADVARKCGGCSEWHCASCLREDQMFGDLICRGCRYERHEQ